MYQSLSNVEWTSVRGEKVYWCITGILNGRAVYISPPVQCSRELGLIKTTTGNKYVVESIKSDRDAFWDETERQVALAKTAVGSKYIKEEQ